LKNVVITGGTGLLGKTLTKLLQESGYCVTVLTRNKKLAENNNNFSFWNVENGIIDKETILNANHIIHLAGEGIAEKRWTKKRKHEIIDSRVAPLKLIYNVLNGCNHNVRTIVSASGINIYGTSLNAKIFTENDKPANNFLATVCIAWENAADEFAKLNIRVVKLRTGVVLSKEGGALQKIILPFKFGLGAGLGSGEQYFSWISQNDICRLYLFALENNLLSGAYNAVVDDETTNKVFSESLANVLNKKIRIPNIHSAFLKILLGEMSEMLLKGNRISNQKIKEAGFNFRNEILESLLISLLR
jgi:uncharacterized protein (TIGR01777 family)